MTKFSYLYCFFLCVSICATGQGIMPLNEKAYTDSLETALKKAQSDSAKARVNYLLSDYWRLKDTLKSKQYLQRGKDLGNNNAYIKALYYYFEGQLYFNFNANRAAHAFLNAETGLSCFDSKEAYKFRANAWFNYGIMKKNEKGDAFFVDVTLNKAIPLMEKAGDTEKLAHLYSQLAVGLMNNSQFEKAGFYAGKAIDLLKYKYSKSSTLLFAYLEAASIYIYTDKNEAGKQMLDN